MLELMLAAPASGSGKTAITCGLLEILKRRGTSPCAFKCGPDYIDPMFHRSVLGIDSHNLDLFLSDEAAVRRQYDRYRTGHQAAVCEGVMGFYDGVGGTTTQASAWHTAHCLQLPVILVLRPKGASLTLAAQIRGLCSFRTPSHVVGVLLNDCSDMLYRSLAPALERESGIPLLGFLPHMKDAELKSRHLGLYTAAEITDFSSRVASIADQMERSVDIDRLIQLCTRPLPDAQTTQSAAALRVRIGIASDEAFCFIYAESLDTLRSYGADLIPFRPLDDRMLPPDIDGLYFPGGYPELYAEQLSANDSLRQEIRRAVLHGMPTVAECGGFLYLGHCLQDSNGVLFPMVGALHGEAIQREKLVRFGYLSLTAKEDSLLFRAGETFPAHEFHYWDSSENGDAFLAVKPVSGRQWRCGFASSTLYAAFPHLYFAGNPALAARFVQAAFQRKRQHT